MVVYDTLNSQNVIQCVKVHISELLQIYPEPVMVRGNRKSVLAIIRDKITWLDRKRARECV